MPPARFRRQRDELTPRERETLQLLATGRTNREIAEEMGISVKTVEGNVERIFRRLNVRNRAAAAVEWVRHYSDVG